MRDRLERRYRLLLLAYPKRYRRFRGREMLTTLMDTTPAGRTRPTTGDAVSILFGGLRCRLSRGGSLLVAIVATVMCAMLGGVCGALLGWQGAPALPDDAAAAAIARIAAPHLPSTPEDRRDFVFGYDIPVPPGEEVLVALLGGDDYTAGYVQFTTAVPIDLRASRDRLATAGWQTDLADADLTAYQGTVFLHATPTSVWVKRATPPRVPILTTAGLLLGALAGWMLSAWSGRRLARQHTGYKITAAIVFGLGTGAIGLPTLWNLAGIGYSLIWITEPSPVWIGFVFIFSRGLAIVGAVLLTLALLIVALGRPSDASPGSLRFPSSATV